MFQCGLTDPAARHKQLLPECLPGSREDIVAVSSGGHFTLQLTGTGAVLSEGEGRHGRLGSGTTAHRVQAAGVSVAGEVVAVVAGTWHGAALTKAGEIWHWGHRRAVGEEGDILVPRQVAGLGRVAAVSCGHQYSLVLLETGEVVSLGAAPAPVPALPPCTALSAGHSHCAAVTVAGEVVEWDPTGVRLLQVGEQVESVSCSRGEHHPHTLLLARSGALYSCGDGYKGKLGQGKSESRAEPGRVAGLDTTTVLEAAAGGIHSAARDSSGTAWTWGCGSDGRLGLPGARGHRYGGAALYIVLQRCGVQCCT